MSLDKPEMVLLDVDGTLVDTVPDLAYAIDCMMQTLNLPECGENNVRNWVGNGIEHLVKKALIHRIEEGPDPEFFQTAFEMFFAFYAENACKKSQVYEGVQEGMDYLKENNFKLGCVTNKKMCFTETLLKSLGLYDDFGIVIAGDSLPRKKPDPLPLLHAAEFFSVIPENSLMIGDSRNDIQAAHAAGFKCLCVTYGYNQGQDIRKSGPDEVVDTLADISGIFH